MVLKGTVTALVTPFKDGLVDHESLRKLVEFQISSGVQGLLACGCTGEPATLSSREKLEVIQTVLETSNGRVPVIAGTGTNATVSTVSFTETVCGTGVDSVLIITPYYNKPTAQGQIAHYTAVADASSKPVIIYNVPGRTGTDMNIETIARLGEHPNIIGVKDAAGSVERVTQLRSMSTMAYMSGDDHLCLSQVLMGGSGVVSVTSNVAPSLVSGMIQLGLNGKVAKAREIHETLYPLFKVLFIESNPSPAKKALQLMGVIASDMPREPLVPLREESTHILKGVLELMELV
ncbi:MAG: 4-hydroxy-tetrahydrodipicolinate synthase [Candidatus Sabulitectum sp.]|nr:4-hydroxy-tetrahydrodipicolinate synthase [Candidatus Sabulitectum sp.]